LRSRAVGQPRTEEEIERQRAKQERRGKARGETWTVPPEAVALMEVAVESETRLGLADIARHGFQRILKPRLLS